MRKYFVKHSLLNLLFIKSFIAIIEELCKKVIQKVTQKYQTIT
jgi:hypothetical protein